MLSVKPLQAAESYPLPTSGNDVVGYVKTVYAKPGDTIVKIAQRYSIGIGQLLYANKHIGAKTILQPWTQIVLPTSYILPPGPREGIVINISELRLYYYPENEHRVITAPVTIGREGWETPLTQTTIIEKKASPEWRPPQSIRQFTSAHGFILPEVVPPGPQNPLGKYALRLGLQTYMIHGTNEPHTIGLRISSGCIRMYPEDIEELYHAVPIGTVVHIINEPYKAGWFNGQLFLESHHPIDNGENSNYQSNRNYQQVILNQHPTTLIDWQFISKLVNQQYGYPQAIF